MKFAAPCSLSLGDWFRSLSPQAQKKFTGRRMHNLVTLLFELLDETYPASLELWQLYWNQSPFVRFLVGGHYLVTRVLPFTKVSGSTLCDVVRGVPFPMMQHFFRKTGQNILYNPDHLKIAIKGKLISNIVYVMFDIDV